MEKRRRTLFIVDDNLTNLNIAKDILSENYNVITIPSADKMFTMLNKTIPNVILLDIEMPEMSGYEAISILKTDSRYKEIPVIFITVRGDSASELEGLRLGAVDYISKPFAPELLVKRIEVHMTIQEQREQLRNYNDNLILMVNDKTKAVTGLQNAIISTITELVECRDYSADGHIERIQSYLKILVDALEMSGMYHETIKDWDKEFLFRSLPLHDVGKIGVDEHILNKPSRLTPDEFERIKCHAAYGVEVIEKIQKSSACDDPLLEHAKIFAGAHHEKWDGTGYPNGLKGNDIPLQGRLMAIADVYDALISDRPYKSAIPHDDAVKIIVAGKGTHFDPDLVELFIKREGDFRVAGAGRREGDRRQLNAIAV
ncbi:MAG: response regulator [Oscillospiraceae bacterium]|nr:response regulator [Oscillospiraceae bacterium]